MESPSPVAGKFSTMEVRPPSQRLDDTSKTFPFRLTGHGKPTVPMGLNLIDIDRNSNVRINANAKDIQDDRFTAHIQTWGGSTLYTGGSSWLEIAPDDPDFQCGIFNTMDDHPWWQPQPATCGQIIFSNAYRSPPKVVVSFHSLDTSVGTNCRVKTYTTDITRTGFKLRIDSWGNTEIYAAGVTWIAHPADMDHVASGSFNTLDVRPQDKPQLENSGRVSFGGKFYCPPSHLFLGINWIDIDCSRNLRLKVNASGLSRQGMTWHLDGWEDTIVYAAGASYLAVDV